MAEPAVVNASPLIYLARGGCFDLLKLASDRLLVPDAVHREIHVRGSQDPTVRAMARAAWLNIIPDPPIPTLIQSWDLGPGESAVLAWALAHPGTEAIIDDLAARRCAAALRIAVRGTLGLVLAAKHRGVISAARPVVDDLRRAGLYLSDRVINDALALVGE